MALGASAPAGAESYREAVEGTSGLVHFWPMGESSGSTLADVKGSANAEVSGSGVTMGQPGGLAGESSTSVLFDGSSGAAHASVDLSGTHVLTVEFWMKWGSFAADDHLALEFTPNFNEYAGGLLVDPDATPGSDFAVSIGKSGSRNTVFFARPSAGAWHHYAFVIDTEAAAEDEITPYVDGHAVSYTKSESGTGAGSFANSTLFWMSRDASTLFGAGSMQGLALYDAALSSETIAAHYELGAGGPKAAFASWPALATAGIPVRLDAAGSSSPGGSITDYAWDFDGGKAYGTDAGSSSSESHTFSAPGTYTVDLRVKDSLGGTATVSHTIVVGAELGAYEQAVEKTSGVSHLWPMGESSGSSIADVLGGAGAELSGSGVTLGQSGALVGDSATAAAFNGSSGAAHAEVDLSATHKLTVEFWLKWNAFAENDDLAMELTSNFNEHPGGFLVDPNAAGSEKFGVGLGEGSSRNNAFFTRPSAEHWHYYALVLDTTASGATQITPYVDGHAVSYTKTAEGTEAGAFAKAVLYWMSRDASSLFGAGSMQDLALYEMPLSAGTIAEHYELGEGGLQAAFASAPVSASVGVPVHFDASGSDSPAGTITDYAWDFDGGKGYGTDAGSSSSQSHTFFSPGTYTVDLRVKDSLGQTATVSHTITVSAALGQYERAVEETSGVQHFWPMGESSGSTFADLYGGASAELSGSGVTLGQSGGLVEDPATAAAFNGSTGSAHAPLNLSGTGEVTVEFWMKWKAYANDDALALEFTPNFNEHPGGFLVDPDSPEAGGKFGVGVGNEGARNNVYFARPSAEAWHYYAFAIDTKNPGGTVITPYVDGHAVSYTKSAEGAEGENLANSTLYWFSRDAASLFGTGSMQDFAIYDTALGESTVLHHYKLGTQTVPSNTTAPSIAGTAKKGHLLTASAGSWSGTSPLTYSYQWMRCDGSGEGCVEVPGATSATYLPGASDVSKTLRVRVTATNEAGSAPAASGVTAIVSETACTDSWIGGSEGEWGTSSNWSTSSVPGSSDVACFAPGSSVKISGTGNQVGALQSEGSLRMTGASMEVMSASTPSEVASLTLESSTLYGLDKLDVTGTMQATGKTKIFGAGSIDVHGTSTPALAASGELIIDDTLEGADLLSSEGEVVVDSGTLDLNGAGVSKVAHLTVGRGNENATLTGSSEIDVTGALDWENGTIAGSSKIVLESGTSTKIDPFGPVKLNQRELINKGTLNWESGAIVAENGAKILNEATFHVDDNGPHCILGCDGVGLSVGSGTAALENTATGKLIKEAGLVTYLEIPFDNQGEVEDLAGQLWFSKGEITGETSNGSWTAGPSGLIEFAGGNFALGEGVELHGEIAVTHGKVAASSLNAEGAHIEIESAALALEGPGVSHIESLTIGQGPNGSGYSTLEGAAEVDVAKAFEFYEGVIRGLDPLVLEAETSGLINPVNDDDLDGATLVNKGKLNWYSGRLVGAGGAVLLNEGVYETNDGGPHHDCEGTCTGYYINMFTASYLREIFKEYSFGESAEHEAEMLSGSATLINEGEITDPEATCGEGKWVEVQWPTEGKGLYDDPCTYYPNFIQPEHPEPEPEEEGEAALHSGVGSPIAEHEDCKIAEGHHCYGLINTVNVNPPSGFLGSSIEIDPTCLSTNGDNENFTDAEQWVQFTTGPQKVEKIKDWTEAGVTVGITELGVLTTPHYFIADIRTLEGHPAYHEHIGNGTVALNQYFKDAIWYVAGSEWQVWLPTFHMASGPQPHYAKELELGTENTANDVAAEAKVRHMEYETTTKGKWRKGWRAEHLDPEESATENSTATAKLTSGTTGEVTFNSRSC